MWNKWALGGRRSMAYSRYGKQLPRPARRGRTHRQNDFREYFPLDNSYTKEHRSAPMETLQELKADVNVPDDADAILNKRNSVSKLLEQPSLVVIRQLEMMNIFVGFEQSNKYAMLDIHGNPIGYLVEQDDSLLGQLGRQLFRTHRPFNFLIMDKDGQHVLRIHRPFSLINSIIGVYSVENHVLVGEAQQSWHLLRRRYNQFLQRNGDFEQFGAIDSPFLAWDFSVLDINSRVSASISRNFGGLGRELFTDTGQYIVKFDSSQNHVRHSERSRALTLDERAVVLANAISIDVDYFSRHSSHSSGLFWPFVALGSVFNYAPEPPAIPQDHHEQNQVNDGQINPDDYSIDVDDKKVQRERRDDITAGGIPNEDLQQSQEELMEDDESTYL
ncbi:hypothetical protein E3P92_03145 [Wallemia ichthyophaga]|uniref:Phospholipid scramblase n=2 Tax=Wallemia ichthyophaga TaxID=245174 RepID=A0A4T0H3D0_WALIC|nr:Altered inheritance rate of mitochondria protein 25 [Wallemia ichthyophaga EXF-994]TIB09758.1 hypothetical protein E3P93_03079 [Wallemia ichthyophaga]EOR02837.1 Altered inheritance rate of mitochondria protein 25 [Wallemia ichthyophaga EXF-994]TIB09825.1 hypothetical protein E3P90_03110 [Wallemia ichthyophaga]TIB10563.1 hypothetical protein E3P92_03145 [Wallemia ichthyophaga]TIB20629.1 hypothetical protein E3P89_03089 [Wallemia ichthyophaga]